MKNTFLNLQSIILFFGSTIILGQNIQINGLDNRNNFNAFNMHLAATKLCEDFYANYDLAEERQNKSSYIGFDQRSNYACHICVESIRYPLMSPMETFVERFLKDKRISRNKSNVFALRTIREELKTKYLNEYNGLVAAVDTENIVFYQTDLIKGYSFDLNELYISMARPNTQLKGLYLPQLLGHGIDDSGYLTRNITGDHGFFRVPMSESKAQEVYDMYANHYHPNPPFRITTKLYYALRLSKEFEGQPRYYVMILKKAEFFLPGAENLKKLQYKILNETYKQENKIAEVVFNEKLYYAEKGYGYQKIASVK